MDMPSFKDVLQKLSVFKNNLSLLIPVVIGVIAVLLLVAPACSNDGAGDGVFTAEDGGLSGSGIGAGESRIARASRQKRIRLVISSMASSEISVLQNGATSRENTPNGGGQKRIPIGFSAKAA